MSEVKQVKVNGKLREINADPERTLLSVLRDDLDLTGTKYGCGEGECGACTVLLDGTPTRSCRVPIRSVGDKEVRTIESLAENGRLHPVQQAFLETGALQCSYCTSGMIMSAYALLKKKPSPNDDEIRTGMNRNICRCGTYQRIVAAVKLAAANLKEAR